MHGFAERSFERCGRVTRRAAVQAGAISFGLGIGELAAIRTLVPRRILPGLSR